MDVQLFFYFEIAVQINDAGIYIFLLPIILVNDKIIQPIKLNLINDLAHNNVMLAINNS